MSTLYLHVPKLDELWYRKKLLEDPKTMSYNCGYELDFDGYDKETGCIAFPESKWKNAYEYLVGNEPKCFYAYLVSTENGEFAGDVNLHKSAGHDWYEMGIVIEAKHRGKGYASEGLRLLLRHAFEEMGANAVHNDFESSRTAAIKAHEHAGFRKYKEENGIIEFIITKEQFLSTEAETEERK